jgi:hypothetical protein
MPEANAGSATGTVLGGGVLTPPPNASTVNAQTETPTTPDSGFLNRLEQISNPVVVQESVVDDNKPKMHFGKQVRLGSRKVTIRLVDKFSILPKEAAADFIRKEVVKKIGSTWKRGTRNIIRGLTSEEEVKYLPRILGVRVESDQWNEKVYEHWANFTIAVPNDKIGIELEAGFHEVITKDGKQVEPINIEDYMRFNFCKEHCMVATEEDQLDNMFTFTYYLVDKQKDAIAKEKEFGTRQEADKLFYQLTSATDQASETKINWILETSGGINKKGMNITGLTKIQKNIALEELKNAGLSKFIDIAKDPHLEVKSLIRKAVDTGVMSQEGNSFFFNDKLLGSSLMTTVAWLTSAANQKDKLVIQEKINQY